MHLFFNEAKSVILTDSIGIAGSRFARIERWLSRTLDLGISKHLSKNPIWNGNENSDILEALDGASEDPARRPFHQWHAQYQHGGTKHHPGVDYKNYFTKPTFIQ